MKRYLFLFLFCLVSCSAIAQKVTIKVLQTKNPGITDWKIIDSQNQIAFTSQGHLQEDTVIFSLTVNKLYYIQVSVGDSVNHQTDFLTLSVNREPVLYIRSDIGKGDHLFPFFTGVKGLNAKITGGTNALIADFPWQVYYISGNFRCGGSIISNRWIVTAAHCTQDDNGRPIPVDSMFIKVGANNPNNVLEGKIYAVAQAIPNEGFDNQSLLNDIALLRLSDSINFANARPIKLISSSDVADGAIVPGVISTVTGWGLTHVSPQVIPTALQKVQLPIVSIAQAATVWGNSIPATDIMAGLLNGNKDACNGDSGGPLVVRVLDEFKLAGLVSWGSQNCNTYGAYTRVSDFLAWIQSKSGITPGFKPPSPRGDSIICHGTESSQYSINPVSGATSYEWAVFPANAGAITGNSQNASIIWNLSFTGSVNIAVRVTINNVVSDWGRFDANIVPVTRVLSQSADTTICALQPVTLNVDAEGYNLTYTWFKDNQTIQTGISRTFSYTSSTVNESGVYKAQITGSCGTVTSRSLIFTVYPLTNITSVSKNTEVPFGNDLTLQVSSEGHNLVYQWQKDGIAISNSNSPDLFLQNMNATDIGIYKVTVSGSCGTQISDTIYVYVKRSNFVADPQVFVWPSVTTNEFSVALNNDAFYNIQVFNTAGVKIREILNCRYQTRINISTIASGVYIVQVYNADFRKSIKIIRE